MAWKTQSIPSEWSRALTTFILKEKDSHIINQFRGIALLNKDVLLGGGKAHDQPPPGKQLHRHQLPGGRSPGLSWLREALGHDLGAKKSKTDLHIV